MHFVERANIDLEKWEALINNTPNASFFSHYWYLDATADSWCILVNSDYSIGLALPFTKKLGREILYTPIFMRYIELLGDGDVPNDILQIVGSRFSLIDICLKQPLFGDTDLKQEYQVIMSDEFNHGSQAKRMLKKADKQGWKIDSSVNIDKVLLFINKQLKGRIEGITEKSVAKLVELCDAAENQKNRIVFTCADQGGIICLEDANKVLYLKGTVSEEAKKNGGMYALMNHAIKYARSQGKTFDFGGSRMEGVKRFNKNLGGTDEFYYRYKIGKAPFWFNLAKRIKHTWKR